MRRAGQCRTRRRKTPQNGPTEAQEQAVVVRWLLAHDILFCAVPNGDLRNIVVARRLMASGVRRGVPDLIIWDRVPQAPAGCAGHGVALEMKRTKGGRLSPEQKLWMQELSRRGWVTHVAAGATNAIMFLRSLGYGDA